MKIKRFNENEESMNLYHRNYYLKDKDWNINILNDIKSLEKLDIKYEIYYDGKNRFLVYALSNFDLSDIYRFDFSSYRTIYICRYDMSLNRFKLVTKNDIELISNTNKFNL